MTLLPDGCDPSPDGILNQVQEESKSPFLQVAARRSSLEIQVCTTHRCYRVFVPTPRAARVNHRRLYQFQMGVLLHPWCPPGLLVVALCTRPADPCPDHPCPVAGQCSVRTVVCFVLYPVLIERQVVKRQQGIWSGKRSLQKDGCTFRHRPLAALQRAALAASTAHIPGNGSWLLSPMAGLCAKSKQRVLGAK